MKENITPGTALGLGPQGEISTNQLDGMTPFSIERLRDGTTIKARHGEDHCRLIYNAGNKRVLTILFGEDDDADNGEWGHRRLYTREPVTTQEPLAEWLDRNGLHLVESTAGH